MPATPYHSLSFAEAASNKTTTKKKTTRTSRSKSEITIVVKRVEKALGRQQLITGYLLQKVDVAVQRGNTAAILGSSDA